MEPFSPIPPRPDQDGTWSIRPPASLHAGGVVGQSLRVWRRILWPAFLISLVLQGVPVVIGALADGHFCAAGAAGVFNVTFSATASPCEPGPTTGTMSVIALFLLPLVYVATLRLALASCIGAHQIETVEAVRIAWRRYWSALLVALALFLILMGLMIPAVILFVVAVQTGGWALLIAVIPYAIAIVTAVQLIFVVFVIEDLRGFTPTGRSWRLVRNRFLRSIGAMLLVGLLTLAVSLGVTLIPDLLLEPVGAQGVVLAGAQAVSTAFTSGFYAAFLAVLYLHLRAATEPLEPVVIRNAIDRFDRGETGPGPSVPAVRPDLPG